MDGIIAGKHHPESPSRPLTWENILKEEPLEGQHWQGAFGLPDGSTIENWEQESSSIDDLSLLDDAEYDEDASSPDSMQSVFQPETFGGRDSFLEHARNLPGRVIMETLQDRQYWRFGWRTDVNCHQKFDIGVPSSLGTGLRSNLGLADANNMC